MVGNEARWELPPIIRQKILGRIMPTDEEKARIETTSRMLLERIREVSSDLGSVDVEPVLAGSVAKGTISGTTDLDVFVIFPKDTPREQMEEMGIKIGEKVLEDHQRKYTQHPYINGTFMGMEADIVPCLKLERGRSVITAVDRTPLHTEYIISRISEFQREEAVLLKSFLKGIGSYGAEDTVNGFSGYLCELLILLHGSFSSTIEWFASMEVTTNPPKKAEMICSTRFMELDDGPYLFDREALVFEKPFEPGIYSKKFSSDTLVIIDPVDPGRNVASPVSDQILAHTALMSRSLLLDPGEQMFSPFSSRPWEIGPMKDMTSRPGRCLISLPLPDGNPDLVVTQARSFISRSIREMERRGEWKVIAEMIMVFPEDIEPDGAYLKTRYLHRSNKVDSPLVLIHFISDPPVLEPTYIHMGPPVSDRRAADFTAKWGSRVKEDEMSHRLYVIAERKLRDPASILLSIWNNIKIGSAFRKYHPIIVENQLINEVFQGALER